MNNGGVAVAIDKEVPIEYIESANKAYDTCPVNAIERIGE